MTHPRTRLAFGLAVAAQVAVLGTAAWDRAGGGGTLLRLGEREARVSPLLPAPASLALVWGDAAPAGGPWLDAGRLAALGFDCSVPPGAPEAPGRYGRALPRRVWVVLEQDGEAWQDWLARAEIELGARRERVARGEMTEGELADATARLNAGRTSRPRLLALDAAKSPAELRRRWPDRRRHPIVAAVVRPRVRTTASGPALAGEIVRLLPSRLWIPPAEARRLEALLASDPTAAAGAPRYAVEVRFGRLGHSRVVRVLPP